MVKAVVLLSSEVELSAGVSKSLRWMRAGIGVEETTAKAKIISCSS